MLDQVLAVSPTTAVGSITAVRSRVASGTIVLFSTTMFTGAGLLFLVQPMFAKLALPRLGGSPSVWNTCVLFFQATLLLGYLYAHFSTRWLGVRRQAYLHLFLLLAPLVALPLAMGDGQPPASASPAWWLLRTMALTVGLPFFVVSRRRRSSALVRDPTGPLGTRSAFLCSASNLGSMLALLACPVSVGAGDPALDNRPGCGPSAT